MAASNPALNLPPIRHATSHATQPRNLHDLLVPRKQHTHRRPATLIRWTGSSTHLREASALWREGRAAAGSTGAGCVG